MAQTKGRTRPGRALLVAVIVVVAALAVGVVLVVQRLTADPSTSDLQSGAVSAARSDVLALTTLQVKTADSQVAKVLDQATADFRDDLSGITLAFERVVTQGQGSSTGRVVSAGAVSTDVGTRTVTVLVAAEQKFSSGTRKYRLTLTMHKSDERWLIAGMVFAP